VFPDPDLPLEHVSGKKKVENEKSLPIPPRPPKGLVPFMYRGLAGCMGEWQSYTAVVCFFLDFS